MQLVAAPASLSFLAVRVHAAAPENETSKSLKVDELSLYTTPTPKSEYVEHQQTQLEDGICYLRHSLEPYTAWFQNVYGKVLPRAEKAMEYGKVYYDSQSCKIKMMSHILLQITVEKYTRLMWRRFKIIGFLK
ncbi:UNVERIFIED_CONTAM: hypothetical protein K2H54_048661 [Gekko kuhli]